MIYQIPSVDSGLTPLNLPIQQVNWPHHHPYKPEVSVQVSHNSKDLVLYFEVREKDPRLTFLKDHDPVYTDSCVEFFVGDGSENYYNFEFNRNGSCLAEYGKPGDRQFLPASHMMLISREASKLYNSGNGSFKWNLLVNIPLHLFQGQFHQSFYANFYKCGDDTEEAHFLSAFPISFTQPNFHLPQFFQEFKLDLSSQN